MVEMQISIGKHACRCGHTAAGGRQLRGPVFEQAALLHTGGVQRRVKPAELRDPVGDAQAVEQRGVAGKGGQVKLSQAQAGQTCVEPYGHVVACGGASRMVSHAGHLIQAVQHGGQAVCSLVGHVHASQAVQHKHLYRQRGVSHRSAHSQTFLRGVYPEVPAPRSSQRRHHLRQSKAIGIVFDHSTDHLAGKARADTLPVAAKRVQIDVQLGACFVAHVGESVWGSGR